ncbi:hypothetical protein HanRHA438_Chr03g0123921 [Helianthus annuus]|nr:hypothetical protein HanRHA438_Chr03g0123921 [Helianthus annuus]
MPPFKIPREQRQTENDKRDEAVSHRHGPWSTLEFANLGPYNKYRRHGAVPLTHGAVCAKELTIALNEDIEGKDTGPCKAIVFKYKISCLAHLQTIPWQTTSLTPATTPPPQYHHHPPLSSIIHP